MIPPPNVTGVLHMGHVLNNTIQDVFIRKARMQQYNTLWLPGTDHASIATEAKVTKMLKQNNTPKKEIGREKFLEHSWEWKEKYGGIIIEQLKSLGASCDWEQETFTWIKNTHAQFKSVLLDYIKMGISIEESELLTGIP